MLKILEKNGVNNWKTKTANLMDWRNAARGG